MDIYRQSLKQLFALLEGEKNRGAVTLHHDADRFNWPAGGERNFVFKQDIAFELGPPKKESVAFLFQVEATDSLDNGRISIIGPELGDYQEQRLDFGLIVLAEVESGNPWNDYRLFRSLEEVRYRIDLEGYMRRGVSQFLREWSRISREAMKSGFGFHTLGQALVQAYQDLDCVRSVEIVLTAVPRTVREMKAITGRAFRFLQAAHKMIDENLMDCNTCEFSDLCRESEDLKSIRNKQLKTR